MAAALESIVERVEVAPGRAVAIERWGGLDRPLVLLLHGGGQSRFAWGDTAARLAAAGFGALAMDHRGHGDSDWHPDGDYGFAGFADDLLAVLAQLPSKPFLVGASLGGITAVVAETRVPGRSVCRGIVLVDVIPRLQVSGVARILEFMHAFPAGFASLEEAADHVAAYLPHRERPRDVRGLEKSLRRTPDGRYRWHWDPRMMGTEPIDPTKVRDAVETTFGRDGDPWGRVRALTVPALLVRGRMSDVVSEEDVALFREAAPFAEYVDVAGAAHMVAGDRNDVFAAAILDFLTRAEAGAARAR